MYYKGDIAPVMEITSGLEYLNCLRLNCQSARNLERRHDILKLVLTSDANFVFLSETWHSGEVNNSETFLDFCYQILSRSDRKVRGVLIASSSN